MPQIAGGRVRGAGAALCYHGRTLTCGMPLPQSAPQAESALAALRHDQMVWAKVVSVEEDGQGRKRIGLSMNVVDQATGADLDPLNERGGRGVSGGRSDERRDDRGKPRMGDPIRLTAELNTACFHVRVGC